MRYSELGKTGIKISGIGFGCMRLPKVTDRNGREHIDNDACGRMFRHAMKNGINYFDTAHTYNGGESEDAVGKFLANADRDKVYIGTKMWVAGLSSADAFKEQLETSLLRLKTDRIDLLFLHALTVKSWKDVVVRYGITDILEDCKKRALIKAICFSSHDTPENVKTLLKEGFFEVVLLQYNMLDRSYGNIFSMARKQGIGTLCMGPVAGGNLAERNSPWLEGVNVSAPCNAELALGYVFANKDIDCVLSGMCSMDQLRSNIKVACRENHLDPSMLNHIDRITARLKEGADYSCTWCKYCMPCPHGVHIPLNLKIHTVAMVYRAPESAAQMYSRLGKEWFWPGAPASACVGCGQCLAKCPQHIDIVKKLRELRAIVSDASHLGALKR